MLDLNNKSILITGGTGSLGKQLTKKIYENWPQVKRLVIYSRDEQKQFVMAQQYTHDKYPSIRYFIGDVRDKDRLIRAMEGIDVVIHAAAMKNIDLIEYNPNEAVKTNITGAQNVIDASFASGVKNVVALSSDKVAAPNSLYGATKITSDRLFITANNIKGNRDIHFSVVRYGSIIGADGSMIPFLSNNSIENKSITLVGGRHLDISYDGGAEIVFHAIEHSMKPISYGRQNITQDDIDLVVKTLTSDFLTQGPMVKEFEEKFAKYVGAKYAVAVTNGTDALHLCNLALGVKPGDKVITTPITFVASANATLYSGGEIDFVDIDPETYTIDLDKLEEKLVNSPKGTYKGVVPVDFAGYPVDVEQLRKIADKHGLWILEDACHAPGGFLKDSKGEKQLCGNGAYADLHIFSFHPVKHIATGEGGMVTTNDIELYNKLKMLSSHGITKDPALLEENHGGWYYEMQDLGYNYRLSDINCALGVSQLKRAKKGVALRNNIARKYDEAFKSIEAIKTPFVSENVYHAHHLYIIQIEDRKGLYDYLRENKIFAQVHYVPVHLNPYYKVLGWKKGDFPISEAYYEKALSLPMFPTLSEKEQNYVIEKVLEFLNK